jgi:hypothetical protein
LIARNSRAWWRRRAPDDRSRVIIRRDADAIRLVPQPAHAHLAAQLARAWDFAALPAIGAGREDVLLGVALHDLAWAAWENAPTLNEATGLPHGFREVRARTHSALWADAVRDAEAFGRWPALLVSLQGSRIYGEFFRRDRAEVLDLAAVDAFLPAQAAIQARLADGIDPEAVRQANALLGAVDWLSLLLCGDTIRSATVPGCPLAGGAGEVTVHATTMTPWPFGMEALELAADCIVLPADARFADAASLHGAICSAPNGSSTARHRLFDARFVADWTPPSPAGCSFPAPRTALTCPG